MKPARPIHYALLVAILTLLGVALLYPIWLTVRVGFADDAATASGFSLRHVALVFADPILRQGLINALALATVTTLLCTAIGLPMAMLSVRHDFPLKSFWNAAALVPLILPPFVGAIGLKAMLGRAGAVNALLGTDWDLLGAHRFWGVAIALALHLYPIIYLNASASLANLDPALDEAGKTCGIGPWNRFFRVTLPLIRPGLFAGGAVVFIWSFTELGTPLMFDYYDITSVQIFNGIKKMSASSEPYALTAVMLAMAIVFYILGKSVLGAPGHASSTRAFRAGGASRLTGLRALGATILFTAVTGAAILPHIGVILMSLAPPGAWYDTVLPTQWTLHNFELALGHPLAFNSIVNSLTLAGAAAAIDLLLGVSIGYLIVRTRIKGKNLLDALAMLPLAVPGLVMAFGYVALTLRWPFGQGDPLQGLVDVVGATPNPIPLLIIAYAVRRLPYVVRSTVSGLQQVHVELEEASSVFGANTLTTMRRVIVPLIAANLLAGGLLAFSFAMLEVSDSLVLAQQERFYPITKAIYTFAERLGDGVAIACGMGVWGMLLLTVTLVGASLLMGKSLGAIFRV